MTREKLGINSLIVRQSSAANPLRFFQSDNWIGAAVTSATPVSAFTQAHFAIAVRSAPSGGIAGLSLSQYWPGGCSSTLCGQYHRGRSFPETADPDRHIFPYPQNGAREIGLGHWLPGFLRSNQSSELNVHRLTMPRKN
jgi:hypothetical protein